MDQVRVLLEAEARDDEVTAVAAAFAEAGIPADVRPGLERKGAGGDFPWAVIVTAPVTAVLGALAVDGYKALKRLLKRLYDARKASRFSHGSVTLVDEESGTWITLPPELPDEAWRVLPEVNLNELPSGTLRWDPKTGQWRDAWD